GLPLSGFNLRFPYAVSGKPVPPLPQRSIANLSIVTDRYFTLMRIPFVEGRAFNAQDRADAPGVCIVNEALAKRLFPGESALGKILLRGPNADTKAEIVGVIHNVKANGLNAPDPDEVYFPSAQLGRPRMAVVARTTGDPGVLQNAIRSA